jgi:hypothetical protein
VRRIVRRTTSSEKFNNLAKKTREKLFRLMATDRSAICFGDSLIAQLSVNYL